MAGRARQLLALRSKGSNDAGLLEDSRRFGVIRAIESALDAVSRQAARTGPIRRYGYVVELDTIGSRLAMMLMIRLLILFSLVERDGNDTRSASAYRCAADIAGGRIFRLSTYLDAA